MKNKIISLNALLIFGLLSVSACNNSNSNGSNTTDSSSTVVTKADTVVQDIKQGAQNVASDVKQAVNGNVDSDFVVKAAIANNEELKLLQAGIDNGTDKGLKMDARKMIADHKKLGAAVKAYADKNNYVLPDDNGNADNAIADLNKNNKGADWDMAWVNLVADKHQDAISMFEKGENNVKDPELKNMIAGALPTFHAHYDMMKQLQDKMEK